MTSASFPTPMSWFFVLAGPLATGSAVALSQHGSAAEGLLFPIVIVGVGLGLLPALYVGSAIAGVAPSATKLASGFGAALSRAGLFMLGLAPALAFLCISSSDQASVALLGRGTIVAGGLFALWHIFRLSFAGSERPARAFCLFSVWAVVAMGLANALYATVSV